MFKRWQRMEPGRARALERRARVHPLAAERVALPGWYFERWHFLPEGYLSRRSARLYDGLVRRLYTAGRQRRADELVARILARRGVEAVLELGCGPGRLLQRLAAALPRARLTGVDLSPYMLELAEARLEGRAALRQADAAALPFEDGSFDAVVACHVLGHVPPDMARATVDEARRVLRPGGVLVAVDHTWHRSAAHGWRKGGSRRLAAGTVRLSLFEAPRE
jgi:SAM-dependent methyltransferase